MVPISAKTVIGMDIGKKYSLRRRRLPRLRSRPIESMMVFWLIWGWRIWFPRPTSLLGR